MKNSLIIFALLVIGSPSLFAGSNSISSNDPVDLQSSSKRDSIVDLSCRMLDKNIYFKLKMMNESRDGYYSMVREFKNGTFEPVDIRKMVANEINQPILYCFVDKEVPGVDFTYVLIRISDSTQEVMRWNYCAETDVICPEHRSTLLAEHR